MSLRLLKTPLIFACFVLVIFMMRQNDITPSKGLRHSMRLLTQRVLASGSRPSTTLCEGIITEDSYSQSEIEKADNVGDSLSGTRGGNPLKDWVVDGSKDTFVDDYAIGLIPLIAPWPVLAIITLLTCIGFVTNWCCIFGCCKKCCKCCKCCHGPKEQGKMKIYMAISGLFLVGLLGSAAAGLSFAPKVAKGMNVTFCTALISMENLVHGETSESWLGFDGIITSLKNVQSQFTTTVNNLNAIGGTGGSTTNMDNAYDDAKNANSYLYTHNQASTSPRADPTEGTYTTSYVANLGPVATSGTATYLIQTELDNWKTTINDATTQIDASINSLNTQQTSIATALSTGLDTAQSITDSLNEVVDSLGDNGDSIKNAVKGVGSGLTALFAVNLVFSIVALGSIGMIKFMKIKFFNKILHFSWCVIILMTLLGFLIVTVTMPLGVVLIESCEVFKLTLTDEDFFNDVTDLLFSGGSSDTKSILHTCFYGSGLALDELGLTNDLSYFDTIYEELDKVNAIIPLSGSYTAANPPPSVVIPAQQTIVDNTLDGTLVDSTDTTTDLKNLNKVTNSAAYSCISVQDTWVLNSGSCVSGYTFLSTDAETKNYGSKVCIGFVDAWMDPSTKDIDLRYIPSKFPASCTNPTVTTVKNFVRGFVANRNDIKNDFGDIKTDLQDVADKQKLYSAEVLTFVNKIKQVQSDVAALKDSLVGETNGVIPNTNCKFIGSDLRKLQVGMCATFASSIYQSSVVMVVMSVFAFLATIFTFCLAKRFSLGIKKDSKVDPHKHNEMAKDDPFADPFQSPTPN